MATTNAAAAEVDLDVLPFVDLRPMIIPGRVMPSDPVDPLAAIVAGESVSRDGELIVFQSSARGLHVALGSSASTEALPRLEELGRPLLLWRATPQEVRAAQSRVWPEERRRPRIGDILIREGSATARDVADALADQRRSGGRIGEILASRRLSPYRMARAVARQADLPLIDLIQRERGRRGVDDLDTSLFDAMPESFWRDHAIVPIDRTKNGVVVAMADPFDHEAVATLESATGWIVRRVVTGQRDVAAAFAATYGEVFTTESREALLRRRPHDSSARLLTRRQRAAFVLIAIALIVCAIVWPLLTLIALNAIGQLYYLGLAMFKLALHATASGEEEPWREEDEAERVDLKSLPIYTILIPVFREAEVLPVLSRALTELHYPHDRLDVKLLIEEDDDETLMAARGLGLPHFIQILMIPASEPRTKPKACNFGLQLARGEFTVIYDAEDIPEPDQLLKAVNTFHNSSDNVACVQAKLACFNRNQNLLTRWFTAEYLMWFDHVLPALHASRLPIPLGGTSNHFRTSVLRELVAWDPYNVAEDADLGIRLHKAGYRTAVADTVTFEEANSRLGNWIRQRSRWIKGYMQTWLVHMRRPVELWRGLGPRGFLAFQAIVGGTQVTFLLTPLYMLLTTAWFLTRWTPLESLFPSWVYGWAAFNLLVGTFAFTYAHVVALARRNLWELAPSTALSPLYWMLMSIAAVRALWQLVTRPSYWEKTDHGLTVVPHMPPEESSR
jgi:glycosyltransferase XagB